MEQSKITLDNPKAYYAGKNNLLPKETIIEVICTKGDKAYKIEMTFWEALKMEKKAGWNYRNYQIGQSSYKITG